MIDINYVRTRVLLLAARHSMFNNEDMELIIEALAYAADCQKENEARNTPSRNIKRH